MDQRTPEWFAARAGMLTGSRIGDALAKTQKGWGAPRGHYLWDLVAERLAGGPIPDMSPLAWGAKYEDEARQAYTLMTNYPVTEVGFVPHPTIPDAGSSPDGLVGDEGVLELKCPTPETHLVSIRDQTIPPAYLLQVNWHLACSKRSWCDYASYSPIMPARHKLWVKRVERDETAIAAIEEAAKAFLAEVAEMVKAFGL